MAQNV
jgi:hypothetical protein